ncbi:MAG: hypothetical protein LJE70_11830, partial [Chromatiaceae bacterium]|nr:hypothetical protein [Chromatiaceae bacterium]
AATSCAADSPSLRSLQGSEYVQVAPSATLRDVLYRISQCERGLVFPFSFAPENTPSEAELEPDQRIAW